MSVSAKCMNRDCGFHFEDGEHVEDCILKLRAHFRMEHPTKAFYETRYLEDIEMFNMTLDEQVGRHIGVNDWRERIGQNRIQPRHIVSACQQIVRHHYYYAPNVTDEAIALAAEMGTPIPDPRDQDAPANPDQEIVMQLADEMLGGMPDIEDEEF